MRFYANVRRNTNVFALPVVRDVIKDEITEEIFEIGIDATLKPATFQEGLNGRCKKFYVKSFGHGLGEGAAVMENGELYFLGHNFSGFGLLNKEKYRYEFILSKEEGEEDYNGLAPIRHDVSDESPCEWIRCPVNSLLFASREEGGVVDFFYYGNCSFILTYSGSLYFVGRVGREHMGSLTGVENGKPSICTGRYQKVSLKKDIIKAFYVKWNITAFVTIDNAFIIQSTQPPSYDELKGLVGEGFGKEDSFSFITTSQVIMGKSSEATGRMCLYISSTDGSAIFSYLTHIDGTVRSVYTERLEVESGMKIKWMFRCKARGPSVGFLYQLKSICIVC